MQALRGLTNNYLISSITKAPNQDLFVTGYTSRLFGSYELSMFKTDPYGKLIWGRVAVGGTPLTYGASSVITANGGVIAVGYAYNSTEPVYKSHTFITEFNSTSGNIIRSEIIKFPVETKANSVISSADGRVFFSGQYGVNQMFLASLNPDWTLAWAQRLDMTGSSASTQGLAFSPDGQTLIVTGNFGSPASIFIASFVPGNGTLKSIYAINSDQKVYNVAINSKGNILVAGTRNTNPSIFLAQLTPDGNLPFIGSNIHVPDVNQTFLTNPIILDLTSTMSVVDWSLVSQNLTSLNSSWVNPVVENHNCLSSARLLKDVAELPSSTPYPGLFSPTPAPRFEYEPLELPLMPVRPTPEDFGALSWDSSSRSSRSITSSLSSSSAIDFSSPTILLWLIGFLLLCAVGRRSGHSMGTLGMFGKKAALPVRSARDGEEDSVVVDMSGPKFP
jgi:hypothetical protein